MIHLNLVREQQYINTQNSNRNQIPGRSDLHEREQRGSLKRQSTENDQSKTIQSTQATAKALTAFHKYQYPKQRVNMTLSS